MMRLSLGLLAGSIAAGLLAASVLTAPARAQSSFVLTGADRRPAISLDGEWASIVDPYFAGLFSFHHEVKEEWIFPQRKARPGDPICDRVRLRQSAQAQGPRRLEHAARVALLL